jgi:hypothetical protein
MAAWGVDAFKVDGCNANVTHMKQLYPTLGAALNASGRPMGKSRKQASDLSLERCKRIRSYIFQVGRCLRFAGLFFGRMLVINVCILRGCCLC